MNLERIRCAIDLYDAAHRSARFTTIAGETPSWPRGTGIRFEFGFFYGKGDQKKIVTDWSGIPAISLGVKAAKLDHAWLGMQSTKDIGVIETELTLDQWNTDEPENAHVVFEFTGAQTNIGTVGQDDTMWMALYTPNSQTLGVAEPIIWEDGVYGDETVVVGDGVALVPLAGVPCDDDGLLRQMRCKIENGKIVFYTSNQEGYAGLAAVPCDTDGLLRRVRCKHVPGPDGPQLVFYGVDAPV
jgi:hypothetical protein